MDSMAVLGLVSGRSLWYHRGSWTGCQGSADLVKLCAQRTRGQPMRELLNVPLRTVYGEWSQRTRRD